MPDTTLRDKLVDKVSFHWEDAEDIVDEIMPIIDAALRQSYSEGHDCGFDDGQAAAAEQVDRDV